MRGTLDDLMFYIPCFYSANAHIFYCKSQFLMHNRLLSEADIAAVQVRYMLKQGNVSTDILLNMNTQASSTHFY